MRNYFLPIGVLAAGLMAAPAMAAPDPIIGKWKTDDSTSIISFYKCGSSVCGKIDRFLVPEPAGGARDTKNSDKSKRDRKLLGLPIFWNLSPEGKSWSGKGYTPKEGRNFNADLMREGNNLKVKGCVMVFCKTAVFTKI
jgi:uncharacterized protein (DUF2147 family)